MGNHLYAKFIISPTGNYDINHGQSGLNFMIFLIIQYDIHIELLLIRE